MTKPQEDTLAGGEPAGVTGAPAGGSPVALCMGQQSVAIAVPRGAGCEIAHGLRTPMLARVAELEARQRPRWAWWEATSTYPALIDAGISVGRCWDIREAHRLLHGGFGGSPAEAATILGAGLPRDSVPILEPASRVWGWRV